MTFQMASKTIGEDSVKKFLNSPDEEAPLYRAILFTTVMGNGIDIQIPIEDMFVLQTGVYMDAQVAVQMAGRFRNANQLHIYQQPTNPTRSTDWDFLTHRRQNQARQTEIYSRIKVRGSGLNRVSHLSKDVIHVSSLIGLADALRNHSINHRESHTDYLLSRQWNMQMIDSSTTSKAISGKIQEKVKADKEQYLDLITTAASVDEQSFKDYQNNNALTKEIEAGYDRHCIETLLGQDVTPEYARAYKNGELNCAVNYLEYLTGDIEEFIRRDAREIFREYALGERQHHNRRHELLRSFLYHAFGRYDFDSTDEYADKCLKDRVLAFLEVSGNELSTVLNDRPDHAVTPMAVLRRVLKYLGLRLKARCDRANGITYFRIDEKSLEQMEHYKNLMLEARYRKEYAEVSSDKIIQFP